MVKLGKQRIDQTNLIKITSVNLAHQCQLLKQQRNSPFQNAS